MEPAAEHVRAAGLVPECYVTNCWGGGDEIADCLLEYGHSVKAGLLVLGTHGRSGLMHVMMGSVAEAVMRSSDIPLLTVRSPAGEAYEPGRRRLVL